MKRLSQLLIVTILFLSCGKSDNPPEPVKPVDKEIDVTSVVPKAEKVSMSVGDEHIIEYAILPSDATNKEVQITTEQPSIVSVSGKVVKALAVGSATVIIRSKSSQVTAKIEIKVDPISVKQISLDRTDLKLYVGQKKSIAANVLPDNATDKSVVWTCSDPGTAKVSENGEVEALKIGTTEIIASNSDGSIKSKATVIVLEDILFITGQLKFNESTKDGKKNVVMETRIDNELNVDLTILAVEGYFDGKLGAVDLESFTKTILAGKNDQLINKFSWTTSSTNTIYPTTWFTKVFFTLKGLTYCLTTKENEATIVKVQN